MIYRLGKKKKLTAEINVVPYIDVINIGDEQLPIDLEELKNKSLVVFSANPDIEVVFQGDKSVSFDSVAKAMAAVQSVGIEKIGIVTTGYAD